MSALLLHWICLIHFGEFLIIQCQILTGPNVCIENIKMFCCKDHYQIGNKCVECLGSVGVNCSQSCPINYYGPKCLSECDCSPDKYCDRVRGCSCNSTNANCTDERMVPDVTSVSTMSTDQFDAESRSRKIYQVKILLPALLIVIVLITVFTVSGRHWYKYAAERSTDSIVTEQIRQEDEQEQGKDEPIEAFYSTTTQRMKNGFSYGDLQAIPFPTTCSHTDALSSDDKHIPRSVVEIRPDSPVVSEVSDDLYFDVSYATQSTLSGDKHHDNCSYPLSPSSENEVRLRMDNISLTILSSRAEESKMEMSSYLRNMPCATLCSTKGGKLHSSPNTRQESPVKSEASDELYLNTSGFNLSNTSCERTEVLERSSSLCPSAFEDDRLDYVNCNNWI